MTTIVCTRDAMYCDSMVSVAGGLSFPSDKVFRIGKELVGTAGNNPGIERFLRWYRGDRKAQIELCKGDSFEVIVLSKKGIVAYSDSSFPDFVRREFHAVGSGAAIALGALAAGAGPRRAVEIACELSSHSGGPIQEHRL